MALQKVKGSLDRIFDKSLQDLVRGIRNHKANEAQYISQCIEQIKHELKQANMAIKSNAVLKLIYLQMLGYDISWAAFNIIEVMSAQKFTFKRIGYFASSQSFHVETDVLMLTTNMIRKDLSSINMYDAAVALNGLSCFMTTDLARDLFNDIMSLMSSTKPYIRKRAVLISYKIFLAYPEALRPAFPRLKDKLEDPDSGVQSAAVNVICELARKNPKNYLSLAPLFFKLMTTSTNNWVLIKIIKLFGSLTPLEPRLGKKLIEPLTNLIHSTSAMSLLYECINTVIQGMTEHNASIQISVYHAYLVILLIAKLLELCVQKLRILIEDSDQNLKYLGLLAMSRILKTHPKAVQAHKDLILQCLEDKDESIRLRALDLLFGMVSKKNLMEIVKKLMVHLQKAEGSQYRDELLMKIIEICSQQNYQYITNFEWYISVLVELTRLDGATHHGSVISSQILDVAIRVKSIRSFAANQMATLLENSHAIITQLQRNGMQDILYAAAYVCGEYCLHLDNVIVVIKAMLKPRTATLSEHIQSIYVQNVMKMYAVAISRLEEDEDFDSARELTSYLQEKLPMFVKSGFLEVQERASSIMTMLKYLEKIQMKNATIAEEVSLLFKGELNPVAPKAQKKVPVPEGLDLDKWINDPPSESSSEEEEVAQFTKNNISIKDFYGETKKKVPDLTPEEIAEKREKRLIEQASNPNYLGNPSQQSNGYMNPESPYSGDLPPISDIDINVPLHVPGLSSSDKYLRQERQRQREIGMKNMEKQRKRDKKKRRGKKGRRQVVSEEEEEDIQPVHTVDIVQEEMPEGAVQTDSEDEKRSSNPYNALDIDLDSPLTAKDAIPVPTHRTNVLKMTENGGGEEQEEITIKKSKKKKEKRKKEKKKRHRNRSESSHKQDNLLLEEPQEDILANGDSENLPVTKEEEKPAENKPEEKSVEDYSFWLSNDATVTNSQPVTKDESPKPTEVYEEPNPPEKTKKHKREKRHKHKKHRHHNNVDEEVKGEPVEERPLTPPLTNLTRYKKLGESDEICINYETRPNNTHNKQFVVSCVFANKTDKQIKNIEFNVLDTLNTKLIRNSESAYDAIMIPFTLLPNSSNEAQLVFTVLSVNMPQKLRGTVTYMTKDDAGSSQHKLDFQLVLPCSTYLITPHSNSHAFTQLLASGELSEKSSIKVASTTDKFSHVIQKLCYFLKFTLIERIEESASLYVVSIQGHHICLLVKGTPNMIAIDAKSSDYQLLSNVLDEVKALFS